VIIQIRGCNGSGKSTIIRKLLRAYGKNPRWAKINGKRKIVGYRLSRMSQRTYVIGAYETPTGGCDVFPTVSAVERWVEHFAKKGNVVFEGAMISTLTGRFVALARKMQSRRDCHAHRFIFAVLDTPLHKCRRRIEKRQAKSGRKNSKGTRPFGTDRAMQRYRGSMISSPKSLKREGMDVRVLNHKKAVRRIVHWLGEE